MKPRKTPDEPQLRENYTDPSQKFHDWVQSLGFERTWIGQLINRFESRFQARKYGLVFLFSIVLAYALNFEIRTPMNYRIGETARTDLVSPLSFEMVDEVTTEEKRLKAESEVIAVMDYDPVVFERVSGKVYSAFRLMRSKVRENPWPRTLEKQEERIKDLMVHEGEFEKELGVEVPSHVFDWLLSNQFSPRLENIVVRNLERWYRGYLSENLEKVVSPQVTTLTVRSISQSARTKEVTVPRKSILDISNTDNFTLASGSGYVGKSDFENAHLRDLALRLLAPNLTVNVQEYTLRKKQARDAVLPVTISIKKNQTIVQEGEPVVASKMALLKEIENLKSSRHNQVVTIAMGTLFFFLVVVFLHFFRRFNARSGFGNKDLAVLGFITIFSVLFVKLFWFITETAVVSKFGDVIPSEVFMYLAPLAFAGMVAGLLILSGEVIWIYTAFMSFVLGLMTEMNSTLVLLTFVGGVTGARGVFNCKKRNDIYWAGIWTGVVNAVVVALMLLISQGDQPDFEREMLAGVPAAFVGGILSSMAALMVVPLLESLFNYTTDVKLLELSSLDHPLLKEMIVKAPGTYHHSMLVGSMVEAAAEQIGANPLLGKVMCYYHDIGKMEHANYFIENQKPGNNPHDHISPYMSKTLLVAHVKDGVEMGMRHKLGKPIIDGILQHHGTTVISFFYNKALDQKAEGSEEVSEDEFRYPGPKPQFREAALSMLADSIEAAARSLDEPTPMRLQNIVRNVVQRKFMDGQLDECNITLKDLSKVELAFTKILHGIYHQRIDYPRTESNPEANQRARSS